MAHLHIPRAFFSILCSSLRLLLVAFISLLTSTRPGMRTKTGTKTLSFSACSPLPWKTRLQIALLSAVTDAGNINRRLINLFDFQVRPNFELVHGVRAADFAVHPSKPICVRVFSPADSGHRSTLPVVVFFHGRGFLLLTVTSRVYYAAAAFPLSSTQCRLRHLPAGAGAPVSRPPGKRTKTGTMFSGG